MIPKSLDPKHPCSAPPSADPAFDHARSKTEGIDNYFRQPIWPGTINKWVNYCLKNNNLDKTFRV